jgi:hypothetical protein
VLAPVAALGLVAAAVVPAVATAGDHVHDDEASADHGHDDGVAAAGGSGGESGRGVQPGATTHDDSAEHADGGDHDGNHETTDGQDSTDPTPTTDGIVVAGAGQATSSEGPVEPPTADEALLSTSISRIFGGLPNDHAHSGGTGNAHFEEQTGECTPSAAQVEAADHLITTTTLALLRFTDPQTAVDAGYRPLGFEPNGVHHYINNAYRSDGRTLDPAYPESILYGRTAEGGLFPIGAMFMMDATGQPGPRVGGCLTPWHTHGPPFAPSGQESAEMMHVWTVPVPGGAFAEHVEGEYARLYLGVEPLDADMLLRDRPDPTDDPDADATETSPADAGSSSTTAARRTGSIGAVLNALNVHRELLCSERIRPRLVRVLEADVVDRICDPVLNGPLPGASAPPAADLADLFAGLMD